MDFYLIIIQIGVVYSVLCIIQLFSPPLSVMYVAGTINIYLFYFISIFIYKGKLHKYT